MMIDTHSHIYGEEFDADRAEVVRRAQDAGVGKILLPNIDSTTTGRVMGMCRQYPNYCYPMMGLHPTSVTAENFRDELSAVRAALLENRESVIAIGEIGMDLYWDASCLKEQLYCFEEQIKWAVEFDLPVAIHCRRAYGYVKAVLDKYAGTGLGGVFHCFSGEPEEMDGMLSFEDFCLGINGIVTFKKSALPEVLPRIPLDRVVLETDAPYLAPVPHRGMRNESSFVKYTLDRISELYNLAPSKVAGQTTANASRLFRI